MRHLVWRVWIDDAHGHLPCLAQRVAGDLPEGRHGRIVPLHIAHGDRQPGRVFALAQPGDLRHIEADGLLA